MFRVKFYQNTLARNELILQLRLWTASIQTTDALNNQNGP